MAAAPAVRVLILLPADLLSQKIGGIQSFVRDFIKFAPADFQIELCSTTTDPGTRPVGEWREIDIEGRPVRNLPLVSVGDVHRRSRIPIALRYTVRLLLHRRRLATGGRVLQFHRAGVPLALIGRGAAAIQVVHLNVADIYGGEGESRWRLLPGLYHRVEDLTIKRMERVFVVNQAGVEFYRRRHPAVANRVAFMPTWYDDSIFRPPRPAEQAVARAELLDVIGGRPDDRLVMFVGRLDVQKDPVLLVEAFAAAADAAGPARLIVIGDGPLRGDMEQRARELGVAGEVHFVGWQPRSRIAAMHRGADALLMASRFEGMPIAVLEALACGLPVAAPAVGEIPRLVSDGVSGQLATERTATGIGGALAATLRLGRDRLSEGAQLSARPYASSAVLGPFYEAHRAAAAAKPAG
ncbi:MAG TPA: glycosyltransferase family 4 protein [Candidatus Limnocylindria bacterium]|nr:glycosyltransferase family 4 protein [Candidatus Limnocylindria bacterium]